MTEESFLTKWERIIKSAKVNGIRPSEVEAEMHGYVEALADAMWQLLDDMGASGQSVCLAAKAQARIAIQPFLTPERPACENWMTLDAAKDIEKEADR